MSTYSSARTLGVLIQVEKLEALIHSEIERKAEMERARNCMMMVVAKVVTFVLQAIAIILKISSILRYGIYSHCPIGQL